MDIIIHKFFKRKIVSFQKDIEIQKMRIDIELSIIPCEYLFISF